MNIFGLGHFILALVIGGDGDAVRLPAVEVSGMPRSYVTITVAVPEQLRGAESVSFEVRLSGLTDVVGRTEGVLVQGQRRRVVLTLRVPADALVGVLDVADIVFGAESGDEFVVPILLRIPAVHQLTVSGAREFRGLRTGDRVDLVYTVINSGNAPDTVEYSVRAPGGWVVRPSGTQRIVVSARTRVEVAATVAVPSDANIGDHAIVLWLRPTRNELPQREVATTLGVTGSVTKSGAFTLRPIVATAFSRSGSSSFFGVTLDGPVADETFLSVRFAPPPRNAGVQMQGLSAVGASGGVPLSGSLSGPDWTVSAGNTGGHLGDLTGTNLAGQGVTAFRRNDRFAARTIAVRPSSHSGAVGGMFGAGYWHETSVGTIGGSVSRLSERSLGNSRELSAVGADFTSRQLGTLIAGASLAYRAADAASGIGVGATLAHERPGERASLRIVHAPGGSAAFARATNEFQFSGSREFTDRWSADASLTRTDDAGNVLRRSATSGWMLGNRYRVSSDGSLFARLTSSSYDASAESSGGFGADDRTIVAGADWRFGALAVSAQASQGVVVRRTELLDGRVNEAAGGQRTLSVDAARHFAALGMFGAAMSVQSTEAGVGLPGTIWTVNGRWQSAALRILGRPTRLTSGVSYQQLGQADGVVVSRGGMTMALPAGVDLAVSLERNPFFRDATGRVGTIAAISLATTARVFSPTPLGAEGLVFEDRNANGRHDADEPGVAGVVVRRGADRVVTSREGIYRLPAAARGRTRVDVATLPVGLVAHPMLGSDALELRDIPLLATGSIEIELRPTADDEGRLPDADLSGVPVILRDASGFEWVGRRTGKTTAYFDGIPTGAYVLRLDLRALAEPVRVDDGMTAVVSPHQRTELVVPVRGRVVRFITPPSRSGAPGRGGRGGASGSGAS